MIPQRKTKSSPRVSVLSIIVSALIQTIAVSSWADVFEVDRFDDPLPVQVCDSGNPMDCLLREAVINANTNPGPDLILIPPGTYNLSRTGAGEDAAVNGNLDPTDSVRMEGAGQAVTIIDGGGPGVLGDRIIDIHASEAEIVDLTIRGGSWVSRAGGIYNRAATLTVERSTITGNSANNWAAGLALRFLM